MGCVIYYLYGEAIPALMAEAKLKGGGAAQALNEVLIDGNEIIAKFDGATELPNHHRELICELGVVEYVEADERSADRPDGCVEADRADELREVQVPVPA